MVYTLIQPGTQFVLRGFIGISDHVVQRSSRYDRSVKIIYAVLLTLYITHMVLTTYIINTTILCCQWIFFRGKRSWQRFKTLVTAIANVARYIVINCSY